ncbi:hypothetical protein C7B62_06630 [Pleurocapsa sp. CCALA 161]|uniref:hypothetical protein n=1 Tax=Pleurocapsa sp. CCALA 161 TaxID=2107688 RepID=UPI000D4B2D0F|nr:hypothetical protein [Pleurocapsa sp. CCALA 161]PSB11100.1 hypothetical protein C7B62_06630 [Pleurocapsa sp. CCALA 161]
MMDEIETISWRELTGNKFLRTIDPAMLTEKGYVKRSALRRIGDRDKTMFDVVYDREYLIKAIGKTVCKHMFIIGKEKTLELVSEAWDTCYPNSSENHLQARRVVDENYAKI